MDDDIDTDDNEPLVPSQPLLKEGSSDREIERFFEGGRLRVVQEKNDIFLSHVIDFIAGAHGSRVWGNLRPEYQRRLRWDTKKKSKLIESIIMNIPVPPVFLYELKIGQFEVMDGQQRLNAIAEFFRGSYALEGLDIWPSLNDRTFAQLPPLLRRGLERAKISAITLMSDSAATEDDSLDLRAQVFERLNTGGEKLNAQELRNSLYSGRFNNMLVNLAGNEIFTSAWNIPPHKDHMLADGSPDEKLRNNNLYKRMGDVEIVLRFFAFKEPHNIAGSVRSMLDGTMKKNRHLVDSEIAKLEDEFARTLSSVKIVMGDEIFRQGPDPKAKPSRPLFDAEMVAFYQRRDRVQEIIANSKK